MSDSESDNALKRQFLSRYDVFTMVDMIKDRPAMWRRADPAYRDHLVRDRCWREILAAFEPDADRLTSVQRRELITVLIKKWCNIRDNYRRYLCSQVKTRRPYIYADRLTFLDSVIKHNDEKPMRKRKYSYHVEKTETPDPEEHENEEVAEEWLNEVHYVDMDEDTVKPNDTYQSDVTNSKDHDSTVNVLVNLLRKEEDEDRAFFKSVLPTVKNLSDENKLEFRIQVMKLLKILKKKQSVKGSTVVLGGGNVTDSD